MSGLAEIVLGLGFSVSGSDEKGSEVISRLIKLGADVKIGHSAQNLPPETSLVVLSSAIKKNNPESLEGLERRIPVIKRAELLAELMRLHYSVGVAGSHGKTTTTSLVSLILEEGGLDPTVIVGGKLAHLGGGGRVGKSDYLVAETDESDRSFLLLKPTIAVVTNIDKEHLNAYSSFADLEESFHSFVLSIPFYGLAILCIDELRELCGKLSKERPIRLLTYGFSDDADVVGSEPQINGWSTEFNITVKGEKFGRVTIPVPGRHVALNSLAAVAVGVEFGVSKEKIISALGKFEGVGRRLERIKEYNGALIVSDYAHHPTEVRATLSALREANPNSKITGVFQPHRYSRLKDTMSEYVGAFDRCDSVLITDIYAAGEEQIEGVTVEALAQSSRHNQISCSGDLGNTLNILRETVSPGDVVVFMGAGSIGGAPYEL